MILISEASVAANKPITPLAPLPTTNMYVNSGDTRSISLALRGQPLSTSQHNKDELDAAAAFKNFS